MRCRTARGMQMEYEADRDQPPQGTPAEGTAPATGGSLGPGSVCPLFPCWIHQDSPGSGAAGAGHPHQPSRPRTQILCLERRGGQ